METRRVAFFLSFLKKNCTVKNIDGDGDGRVVKRLIQRKCMWVFVRGRRWRGGGVIALPWSGCTHCCARMGGGGVFSSYDACTDNVTRPSSKGKPTDPKLREKVKEEVKQETNKDGGGKGEWSAWKVSFFSSFLISHLSTFMAFIRVLIQILGEQISKRV